MEMAPKIAGSSEEIGLRCLSNSDLFISYGFDKEDRLNCS